MRQRDAEGPRSKSQVKGSGAQRKGRGRAQPPRCRGCVVAFCRGCFVTAFLYFYSFSLETDKGDKGGKITPTRAGRWSSSVEAAGQLVILVFVCATLDSLSLDTVPNPSTDSKGGEAAADTTDDWHVKPSRPSKNQGTRVQ